MCRSCARSQAAVFRPACALPPSASAQPAEEMAAFADFLDFRIRQADQPMLVEALVAKLAVEASRRRHSRFVRGNLLVIYPFLPLVAWVACRPDTRTGL